MLKSLSLEMLKLLKLDNKRSVDEETQFLIRAGLFICLFAASCIALYSIYNFAVGNIKVGFATTSVVIITLIGAWRNARNIYQPFMMSLGVLPLTIGAIYFAAQNNGLAGALWAYPTILAIYAILKERHAWASNTIFSIAISVIVWQVEDPATSVRFVLSLVATIVYVGIFKRQLTSHQHRLELAAITDSLTGLLNRTWLSKELAKAQSFHNRTQKDVAMLIIDIDKFKYINDTFGHIVGDKVLKSIGAYLKGRFRPTDAIFRVGGEEFIIIMYDTDLKNASEIGNTLVNNIQSLRLHDTHQVTVSIGLACLEAHEDIESWMGRADKNMYSAKTQGRNQIAF